MEINESHGKIDELIDELTKCKNEFNQLNNDFEHLTGVNAKNQEYSNKIQLELQNYKNECNKLINKNVELQNSVDNLEQDRRILKDNIENIDKSLEIALKDNQDIILKNDEQIKLLNVQLSE